MAIRYGNFKEKLAQALTQNPNLTKADVDNLRKRYRSEYNRLLKLQSSADSKMQKIAKLSLTEEKTELLPRRTMLSPQTRAKLLQGTFEEFFERADQIHSSDQLAEYIEESFKQEEEQNDDAFNFAREMAEAGLEDEYNPEPYNAQTSSSMFLVRQWWSRVSTPGYSDITKNLPTSILQQVANWKNATLRLIGPDNFIDLMQNKMGYHVDAIDGDLDWETFFGEVYIESEHRYESDAEAADRISFWMQKATNEAMQYLNEDEDTDDYDEVTQDVIDKLDDISMYIL